MADSADTRLDQRDPRSNVTRAWKILADPSLYPPSEHKQLVERGGEHYLDGGSLDYDRLLTELSQFTLHALKLRGLRENVVEHPPPWVEYPGKIALLTGLSIQVLDRHPVVNTDIPRPSILDQHIRDYYCSLLISGAQHNDKGETILLAMGRPVYRRDQEDEYGPPAGQPVEAVVERDRTGDLFFDHSIRFRASRLASTGT